MKKCLEIIFNGTTFLRLMLAFVIFCMASLTVIMACDLTKWIGWQLSGGEAISSVGKIIEIVESYEEGQLRPILKIRTKSDNLKLSSFLTIKDINSIKKISSFIYIEYIPDVFDGDRLTYLKSQNDGEVYYTSSFQRPAWAALAVAFALLFNLGVVYGGCYLMFKMVVPKK